MSANEVIILVSLPKPEKREPSRLCIIKNI
jgi:hypothetical protein